MSKIYAIGDIHGDIMPLIICLRDCCKVIKKKEGYNYIQNEIDKDLNSNMLKEWNDSTYVDDLNYMWIGGDSNVVFCGDLLDNVRGPIYKKPQEYPFEEARIFKFINSINKQAVQQGGKIYKILGNHDMYNLNGETPKSYSSYVSKYAKQYEGYKMDGATSRLDYFRKGNPGAKLIGEDGAYLFLMIKDFIFVHGGISNSLLNVKNINDVNQSLMDYIYDKNNNFNSDVDSIENQLTFSNDSDDGLVHDRFFGFKNGKSEDELCSVLYNRFKILCKDIKEKGIVNDSFKNSLSCNPNKMKLVIGHCNQNKHTSDKNKIFKSSYSNKININHLNGVKYSEEFIAPVYKGEPIEGKSIYGITVSCGDRDDNNNIDYDNPSIFRIDVGMSRGFNTEAFSEEFSYSRAPQVLKIEYINDKPFISIIKTTFENMKIHMKDLDLNPYEIKYLKYKMKYLNLKNCNNY